MIRFGGNETRFSTEQTSERKKRQVYVVRQELGSI
jgi:hypothetical protein